MLQLKELTIEDKELIDNYFKKYQPKVSELTFTNIFAWRHHYNMRYAIVEDFLCLFSFEDEKSRICFHL